MSELRELVAQELSLPVDPRVTDIAQAIAARHGDASRAVLFYGSCLREGVLGGGMLDFYLIVSGYRAAYAKRWLAAANRLIPPNVFYFEKDGLAAKYAVLSEADLAHECTRQAWTVSTAARFAQPSRLVWARDSAARRLAIDIVAEAAPSLLTWAMPLIGCSGDLLDFWREAFANTFAAEIRAEDASRAAALVDADPERYRIFGDAAFRHVPERRYASAEEMRRWWRRKQLKGKLYSVARLTKASFTFAGGADYIAWKINRHAGADIRLKPWQRRHPLIAGLTLLPRLLRSGAVR
jgi:hypothetical protein